MSTPTPSTRLVKLQLNTTGAWRDVVTFDVENSEVFMGHTELILRLAYDPSKKGLSARVIIPGDVAPLMTWHKASGWVEWKKAA